MMSAILIGSKPYLKKLHTIMILSDIIYIIDLPYYFKMFLKY